MSCAPGIPYVGRGEDGNRALETAMQKRRCSLDGTSVVREVHDIFDIDLEFRHLHGVDIKSMRQPTKLWPPHHIGTAFTGTRHNSLPLATLSGTFSLHRSELPPQLHNGRVSSRMLDVCSVLPKKDRVDIFGTAHYQCPHPRGGHVRDAQPPTALIHASPRRKTSARRSSARRSYGKCIRPAAQPRASPPTLARRRAQLEGLVAQTAARIPAGGVLLHLGCGTSAVSARLSALYPALRVVHGQTPRQITAPQFRII